MRCSASRGKFKDTDESRTLTKTMGHKRTLFPKLEASLRERAILGESECLESEDYEMKVENCVGYRNCSSVGASSRRYHPRFSRIQFESLDHCVFVPTRKVDNKDL